MGWQIAATSFMVLMLCFFLSPHNKKESALYTIMATVGCFSFLGIFIGLIIQIWQ